MNGRAAPREPVAFNTIKRKETASVVWWLELLATDQQVSIQIPRAIRFSEK
jgi:hypothetical protein